ncbi:MAG TPA: choice-of-anchor D domain-containing protein [Candidatus Limnocylindria bacterium]|nr:choice-of-anchor D domain-containing protein [Candidatus Limnocylindria bacterium]
MTTFAGSPGRAGNSSGPALGGAQFDSPQGVAVALDGTVYVADTGNSTIRRIATDGTVSTIAGVAGLNGTANGKGSEARFFYPAGLAIDEHGDLLVADTFNHAIRKVTPDGVVTTFAGKPGSPGSGEGASNLARFNDPSALTIDSAGNVYVADSGNNTIRLISANGMVSTLAGKAGQVGTSDGFRSAARFNFPSGITLLGDQLWVADTQNHAIRTVTLQGQVSTIAGQAGTPGALDGIGRAATFRNPHGIAVDSQGYLFLADDKNHVVRSLSESGVVNTVAGVAGSKGTNDGPSLGAKFSGPTGLTTDSSDTLFIADTANHVIRKAALAHPRPTRIIKLGGDLNFGEVNLGTHPTRTLTIANLGNTVLQVTQITAPGGFTISWTGSVQPHFTNEITVTFGPTAVADYSGEIVVQSDATAGIGSLQITGAGVIIPLPVIALSGDLSFGVLEVGSTNHRILTISNIGNGPLEVSRIVYPGGFAGAWAGIIPAGSSQAIDVVFLPTTESAYEGRVEIVSNASSGEGTLAMSGIGLREVRREVTVTGNLAFVKNSVGLSDLRLITVVNEGYRDLNVARIVCPDGFVCPWHGLVPAGSRRNIIIWFTPDEVRDYSGFVVLESDAGEIIGRVPVSGTGMSGWTESGWRISDLTMRKYSVPGLGSGSGRFDTSGKHSICISPRNEIAIIDSGTNAIWRATPLGAVSLLAGNPGSSGKSDGKGMLARFSGLTSATFSSTGELYVVDAGEIRRITQDGNVTSLGSFGLSSLVGDPLSIAWSEPGYLYISDYRPQMFQMNGQRVTKRVESLLGYADAMASSPDGHVIAAISGAGVVQVSDGKPQVGLPKLLTVIGGVTGHGFRDGNMSTALFARPSGVAVDLSGNIFIADNGNHAIRMIDPVSYGVKTILGNGPPAKPPTGVFGTDASVDSPISVAVDSDQNLVILENTRDYLLRGIRKGAPSRYLVQTMAYSFGTVAVGESVVRDLALQNPGDSEIHVSGVTAPQGFRASWSGAIAPGQTVNVPVEFNPSGIGNFQGLILVDSDANQGLDTYSVSGVAVDRAQRHLSVFGSFDFGECVIGEEVHRTVTNRVFGGATVRVFGVSLPSGFYGATGKSSTPNSLNSTNDLTLEVVFRPAEVRAYGGLMVVNSDASGELHYVSVSGRGRAKADPKLEIGAVAATGPFRITWPGAQSGYLLESSETLGQGAIWTPRTNGILTISNQFSISIERDRNQEFFRLRKP